MIDTLLLIVAAACQVWLAYIGVHVSLERARDASARRRIRRWSIVVGVVGLFALVVSGYRSASVQQTIKDGVDKLIAASPLSKGTPIVSNIRFRVGAGAEFITRDVHSNIIYLRVLAQYTGSEISVCALYLRKLELVGDRRPILENEAFKLTAEAGGEQPPNEAYTFSNNNEHYYNIASIVPGNNNLTVESKQFSDSISRQLLPGIYKFSIMTQAFDKSSCPTASADVWVEYKGGADAKFLVDRFKQS
jgi:uncharacterized membrane protein